jgi:hypothetical protein
VGGCEARVLARAEPTLKYHPCYVSHLTLTRASGQGTVLGGQFDWGGLLPKSNGGVQRHTQRGWQSRLERKGRSVLNCETQYVEQMRKQDLVIRRFHMEGPSLNR